MKTHVGKLQVIDDAEELARIAAAIIVDAARMRPRVGIWVAGGSTARRAYEMVAVLANAQDFAGVHLWMVDDRAVPLDHPESNAGMILRLWGALGYEEDVGGGVLIPTPRFHAMPCGRGIEKQIKETERALFDLAGPIPHPDLTVLGVGADGHIGGLYPGDAALDAGGFYTSVAHGARVAATRGLLAASRRIIYVVAGAGKADIAARVFADPHATPAGLVALEANTAGSEVTWLLDRDAVGKIS